MASPRIFNEKNFSPKFHSWFPSSILVKSPRWLHAYRFSFKLTRRRYCRSGLNWSTSIDYFDSRKYCHKALENLYYPKILKNSQNHKTIFGKSFEFENPVPQFRLVVYPWVYALFSRKYSEIWLEYNLKTCDGLLI